MYGILGITDNANIVNRSVSGGCGNAGAQGLRGQQGVYGQQTRMSRGQQAAQIRRMAGDSDGSSYDSSTARNGMTYGASSIISSSQAQAESIRNSRIKSKETTNEIRKLRYNFKDISSQLIRSKTSRSAKQVASKAHREVLRLKRAKASGSYEADEVEAALNHAKAIERVAKKKAAHLEQEELIHITDKPGTNSIAEELKEHPEKLAGEEDKDILDELTDTQAEAGGAGKESAADVLSADFRAAMEALRETFERQSEMMSEEMSEQLAENMDEMMQGMSELMEDITDQMNELLEELGLMAEQAAVPKEMNEADFKMLVTKHRTDEMKEIAEADKEYLKIIFDKYSKMKAGALSGGSPAGMGSAAASVSPVPASAPAAITYMGSAGAAVPGIPMPSGGFDICV